MKPVLEITDSLIKLCAWCCNTRDWIVHNPEHAHKPISHGICQACYEQQFSEMKPESYDRLKEVLSTPKQYPPHEQNFANHHFKRD
jgi:hypothetical protein